MTADPRSPWIGKEEYGGVPTPSRRGDPDPPFWRLEAVAATERPRTHSVSVDGTMATFVQDRDTSDVWLLDITTLEISRLTSGRELVPYWEDTTPVISPGNDYVAYSGGGWVWIVPVGGGPPRKVVEATGPVWLGADRLIVTVEREERSRLAIVSIANPWPQPLVRGSERELDLAGDEGHAVVSPDGHHVAFTFNPRADLNRTEIRVVDVETGSVRALTGRPATHDAEPDWSPDGTTLAFVAQRGEWYELRTVDVGSGEERLVVASEGDFGSPCWHADGSRVAAVRASGFAVDLVTVDVADGTVISLAEGGAWETPRWIVDGALLVGYEDHRTPPELRILGAGRPRTVVTAAPVAVRRGPYAAPEQVRFESSGGVTIDALLFRPRGPRPVPAVVYPHGGPTEFYGDHWDGHAQYFVDKGYGWLALNYRGSTGRGRTFERLNFGDWGGGDVQDCISAADFLRTLEWVDGRRLAIVGASYGSYLALGSAVEDAGERFRCAVCTYGDCDLLTTWAQGDRAGVHYCGENMLGHPSENRDTWLRGSPVHRLDRLAVPLLIAHGERDERVHPLQSEQLVAELRRLDKTFEYVTYPTESHGFLRVEPQLDFYRRLARFLDWYLL